MSDLKKSKLASLRWRRWLESNSPKKALNVRASFAHIDKLFKTTNSGGASLAALAETLGKDVRTIRRYCEMGIVPEAKKTKGGHWRVRVTEKNVQAIKRANSNFARRRARGFDKTFKKSDVAKLKRSILDTIGVGFETENVTNELHSVMRLEDSESIKKRSRNAAEKRLDQSALMAAALRLPKKSLFANSIASELKISRATLYRHFNSRQIRLVIETVLNPEAQFQTT